MEEGGEIEDISFVVKVKLGQLKKKGKGMCEVFWKTWPEKGI